MKIEIRVEAIEKNRMSYFNFVKRILSQYKINYTVVNLPKSTKKLTLIKSPHVNKKAREQFELSKYTKSIQFFTSSDFKVKNLF